jgi:phosphatidate cytidylyltransferase
MSLRVRTTTALIFGVVMIGGTLIHPISSAILYMLVGVLCLWEFTGLVLENGIVKAINPIRRISTIILGLLPAALIIDLMLSPFPILKTDYVYFFYPLYFIPFILELIGRSSKPFQNMGYLFLGGVYIGLPAFCWINLSLGHYSGRFLIMAIMLLVWANDVFAYLIGSKIGRLKIFPHISPNKTLEGTLGGFFSALAWGVVSFFMWYVMEYSLLQWLILATVCSVFGILGDLIMSLLKRSLNIKDTGNTLPGHGGLLDRFDAFILATPFVAYTIIYFFQDNRFFLEW